MAWHLLRTGEPGAWGPIWEALLRRLAPAIPDAWQVLVMADRGLYSRNLYQAIGQLGWHPYLRLAAQGTERQVGRDDYQALKSLVPADGSVWSGRVTCIQRSEQLRETTLLSAHVPGSEESWFVVTDLEPASCVLAWYSMRWWIEVGFKQGKRGGWQWQHLVRPTGAGARHHRVPSDLGEPGQSLRLGCN